MRLHLGADAHDARFVEILERLIAHVGDVARDLLLAQLGVAGHALEFLYVNRGEMVVLDQTLRDEDRVLEVVSAPGHEGDENILAQRQFTLLGGRTVGDDIARLDMIAWLDDGPLVDAGVLVGSLELDQVVDVRLGRSQVVGLRGSADHDASRIDGLNHALAPGHHRHTRIARHNPFHTRTDQRRSGSDERHRLPLHVGAHEGAVGVVVLQKGNQRRSHRHQLVGQHVHQGDLFRLGHHVLAIVPAQDHLGGELAFLVERRVRLGDEVTLLLQRRVETDLVGRATLGDLAVGRLDEAELVDPGVGRQRCDETDIGAFRGFDRADAPVVRGMHVAHLEAGPLAREAARAQSGEPALVGDLGKRVGLVHELRQLRGPEVLLDHRGDRLGIDQVVRHERLDLLRHAHALFDRALHAHEADAVLVLHQLAHRAYAAVAQVIDVVDLALAVLEVDEVADGFQDVALGENGVVERLVELELVVQLEATDLGQIVALGIEEEVAEEILRRLDRGRIARAQAAVDLHDRLIGGLQLVRDKGIAKEGTDVQIIDEQDLDASDAVFAQFFQLGFGQLFIALKNDLARGFVDDVRRSHFANQLGNLDRQALDVGVLQLLDSELGELAVLLDQNFARLRVAHIPRRPLARKQIVLDGLCVFLPRLEEDGFRVVVVVEQVLGGVAKRAQKDRRVQLAPPVDAHIEEILGIELEIEP